jgi:hypothetical protein
MKKSLVIVLVIENYYQGLIFIVGMEETD